MSVGQDVSMICPKMAGQTLIFTMSNIRNQSRSDECETCLLPRSGGAGRDRTDDLKLAKLPLSQLSYSPLRTRVAVSSPKSDGGPG